jgi:hypothetical protein
MEIIFWIVYAVVAFTTAIVVSAVLQRDAVPAPEAIFLGITAGVLCMVVTPIIVIYFLSKALANKLS